MFVIRWLKNIRVCLCSEPSYLFCTLRKTAWVRSYSAANEISKIKSTYRVSLILCSTMPFYNIVALSCWLSQNEKLTMKFFMAFSDAKYLKIYSCTMHRMQSLLFWDLTMYIVIITWWWCSSFYWKIANKSLCVCCCYIHKQHLC